MPQPQLAPAVLTAPETSPLPLDAGLLEEGQQVQVIDLLRELVTVCRIVSALRLRPDRDSAGQSLQPSRNGQCLRRHLTLRRVCQQLLAQGPQREDQVDSAGFDRPAVALFWYEACLGRGHVPPGKPVELLVLHHAERQHHLMISGQDVELAAVVEQDRRGGTGETHIRYPRREPVQRGAPSGVVMVRVP
nr:hypothetical protein [Mycobacteroides abscessus]